MEDVSTGVRILGDVIEADGFAVADLRTAKVPATVRARFEGFLEAAAEVVIGGGETVAELREQLASAEEKVATKDGEIEELEEKRAAERGNASRLFVRLRDALALRPALDMLERKELGDWLDEVIAELESDTDMSEWPGPWEGPDPEDAAAAVEKPAEG